MAVYIDTSALAKLVVRERETGSLRRWLGRRSDPMATSELARTELLCATRRVAPDRMQQARAVLEVVDLIRVSTEICESAAMIEPTALRGHDAIHIASALALGDELDVVVAYDERPRRRCRLARPADSLAGEHVRHSEDLMEPLDTRTFVRYHG